MDEDGQWQTEVKSFESVAIYNKQKNEKVLFVAIIHKDSLQYCIKFFSYVSWLLQATREQYSTFKVGVDGVQCVWRHEKLLVDESPSNSVRNQILVHYYNIKMKGLKSRAELVT